MIEEKKMVADMHSRPSPLVVLRNEDGIMVIFAVMILMLLTIIGIASTNISNTEIQMAGNELTYQQNLYRAEGAAIQAVELLEGLADPKTTAPSWLQLVLGSVTASAVRTWQFGGSPAPEPSALVDTSFIVASQGIAPGTSVDMASSKVHAYAVYGRSAPPRKGASTIQLGYLKAF
jgi:hypothetical protein